MNKKIINFIAILIIFYILFIGFSRESEDTKENICFKENCLTIEIADSQTERLLGLMYRKNLDKTSGMLFVFEEENIYPFWMKNTLIPLDMVWINENQKIVFIKESAQPCKTIICPTTTPDKKAKYVLEINAGLVKKLNINIGDIVNLSY